MKGKKQKFLELNFSFQAIDYINYHFLLFIHCYKRIYNSILIYYNYSSLYTIIMFKYRCKFIKVNYLTKSKNLTFFFRFKIQIVGTIFKMFQNYVHRSLQKLHFYIRSPFRRSKWKSVKHVSVPMTIHDRTRNPFPSSGTLSVFQWKELEMNLPINGWKFILVACAWQKHFLRSIHANPLKNRSLLEKN